MKPNQTARRLLQVDIVALLLALSGIAALLSLPLHELPPYLQHLLPFHPSRALRVFDFLAGLALIYVSSQLRRKKRNAWVASCILLVILICIQILRARQVHHLLTLVYAALLGLLVYKRKSYIVRTDSISLRRSLIVAGSLLFAVLLFTVVTFVRIDQKEFGRTIPTSQTFTLTVKAIVGQPLPQPYAKSRRSRDSIFSLQAALVAAGAIVTIGLFAPISLGKSYSAAAQARARRILERYGSSSEDYLKLFPKDKHYYFYGDSFIAYGVANGIALIIDGATGNREMFDALRENFLQECKTNGWYACILHANSAEKAAWENLGLRSFYLGSEARVQIEDFIAERARDKHFRYVRNKAERDGLVFEELARPASPSVLTELRSVSDAWLDNGRREYRFIMGYFDDEYLAESQLFVLRRDGKIVAYVSVLPQFQPELFSIDHMRSVPDVSPAAMHFLIMQAIIALQSSGAKSLNLGLAALSQLDENVPRPIAVLLERIKSIGGRFYSFSGLEQFKNKFGPDWEPTYLVLNVPVTSLPVLAASFSKLTTYSRRSHNRTLTAVVILLSIFVAFGYSSFPLAIWVNPGHAWTSMVSVLGQAGQPFASLFNNLDIASSCLAIVLLLGLLTQYVKLPRLLVWSIVAMLLSNIGNLAAAYQELPSNVHITSEITLAMLRNPSIVLHGLASFINTGAFVAATIIWAVWAHRNHKAGRQEFAYLIVAICTVGALIGAYAPVTGPYIQRASIVSYGVWFVIFCLDVVRSIESRSWQMDSRVIPSNLQSDS